MAIIILEGIVATGKTVLSRGIEAHAEWQQYPTRTVISEHYTERVLELTSPTMEDRLALLELHLSSASQLHRLWGTYRFSGNMKTQPQFIYDRFHVTHAAQIGIIEPFLALEEQLQELDTTLVLLVHPPEELAIRILATRHERGLMWKRWLASLGDDREIVRYFSCLQERSIVCYEKSRLKKIMLTAHSASTTELAETIIRHIYNK